MNRILIIFAHPALEKSRVQYRLSKAALTVEGVHFHDLYEHYPDFMIDVGHEQGLLREHDIILFQHPFYWYSAPALVKEWQDLVLEFGFAYGVEKTALHDKYTANIISAGGGKEAYHHDGYNHYSIRELLRPFEQTATLCGMKTLPPFVVHGTHEMSEATIDAYAEQYSELLSGLRSQIPDPEILDSINYLNDLSDVQDWKAGGD